MARRKRYHLPGGTFHVMLRGNAGEQIFFCDEDRCRMCLLIQEGVERYGHRVIAYCFMSNHLHLAIQIGQFPLSQIIQNLAFRYARYINWKHKRIGHLFQGRFKAVLVDDGKYLKELVRYIHLNPVRAGMVETPEAYKWSSHNAYLGDDPLVWIISQYLLRRFSDVESTAIHSFYAFVRNAIGVPEEIDFKSGSEEGILGEDNFVTKVKEQTALAPNVMASIPLLTQAICKHYGIAESVIKVSKERRGAYVRGMLALLVRETEGLTLEALGDFLNKDANTLGKQAGRLFKKAQEDESIRIDIQNLRTSLNEMSYCPA